MGDAKKTVSESCEVTKGSKLEEAEPGLAGVVCEQSIQMLFHAPSSGRLLEGRRATLGDRHPKHPRIDQQSGAAI